MIIRALAAAGLMLAAAPAIAADKPGVAPGIAKSCVKQQVHTPAGKMVHNAPVYFCGTKAETVAANDKLPRTPDTSAVARD